MSDAEADAVVVVALRALADVLGARGLTLVEVRVTGAELVPALQLETETGSIAIVQEHAAGEQILTEAELRHFEQWVRPDTRPETFNPGESSLRHLIMREPVKKPQPKFLLGVLHVTPEARAYFESGTAEAKYFEACLERHVCGDWGSVNAEERERNDGMLAAHKRGRPLKVMSVYPLASDPCIAGPGPNTLWVMTEQHGSQVSTTVLLPHEYERDARRVEVCPGRGKLGAL